MRLRRSLRSSLGVIALGVLWAAPAHAVTASIPTRVPSITGQPVTFDLVVTDAMGPAEIRWDMGDETRTEFTVDLIQQTHTYAAPGHYPILVTVRDTVGFTSVAFVHTVHEPLTEGSPTGSTDLVYDPTSKLVYSANYDNDSVSVVDAVGLAKVAEVPVSRGPISLALAPGGKLWVLHRDAHSIAIIDTASNSVEQDVMLPYASQPMGLAFSPSGDAAYVSLMALGKLLKLDPSSGMVLGEAEVGASARGVSVSHDGSQVYVTRFISQETHGEVVRLNASLELDTRFELASDTTTLDTDQQGRGLPNYLFSVGLSPDGQFAWVPGKKDNIFRGMFRDEQALSDDNTVRPLIALLNTADGVEQLDRRIDLDDRNLPNQVVFTPLGDYAFVSVAGSALVEVREAYTGGFVTALKEAGFAPRGLALTEDNKLFVHASLSRSLVVYDVADIVNSVDQTTKRLMEIPTVEAEKLAPEVLRGKQLFFNSSDIRMSDQGYISCASCHFDGAEDGRVWDFASAGEGLRNSVSLLGRRGTEQGNVNWSGSFDEIQDADDNIRNLFGGKGFLTAEQLAVGTVGTALGDKKQGLSPELDAIAAFLTSLDTYHASPYRNPDGTLTPDGALGRALFNRLGCGFCHTRPDATDSSRGKLHDVGTLKPTSGTRGGEPLLGIDTPTLNGVWETAPYLHDGSAATLLDVLTTANPEDQHAFTSGLTEQELAQLVSMPAPPAPACSPPGRARAPAVRAAAPSAGRRARQALCWACCSACCWAPAGDAAGGAHELAAAERTVAAGRLRLRRWRG
jgi:YVTN family beta-propeller protein